MKLTADKKGRLTCAELFTPEVTFDASRQPDGSVRVIELVEKELPPANVRLVRKNGYSVLVSDRPVDLAVIKELLADFP